MSTSRRAADADDRHTVSAHRRRTSRQRNSFESAATGSGRGACRAAPRRHPVRGRCSCARGGVRRRRTDGDPRRAQLRTGDRVDRSVSRFAGARASQWWRKPDIATSASVRPTSSIFPMTTRRSITSSSASSWSTSPLRSTHSVPFVGSCDGRGTITVIEGDHGSTFFHPDSSAAPCRHRLPGAVAGALRWERAGGPLALSAPRCRRLRRCPGVAAHGLRRRVATRT